MPQASLADAHLKRHGAPCAAVVVAVTSAISFGLAEVFGAWERIFQGDAEGWPGSLDGRRGKRVLVKITGEQG